MNVLVVPFFARLMHHQKVIIQTPTLKFLLLWDKARMRGIKLGNQSDPLATGSLGTGNPARL